MPSFATRLSRAFPRLLLLAFVLGYMPYLVFKQSGCGEEKRPLDEVFREKPVLGAPEAPTEDVQPPGAQPPGAQPPGAQPPGAQPPGAQAPGAQAPGAQPPDAQPPDQAKGIADANGQPLQKASDAGRP